MSPATRLGEAPALQAHGRSFEQRFDDRRDAGAFEQRHVQPPVGERASVAARPVGDDERSLGVGVRGECGVDGRRNGAVVDRFGGPEAVPDPRLGVGLDRGDAALHRPRERGVGVEAVERGRDLTDRPQIPRREQPQRAVGGFDGVAHPA